MEIGSAAASHAVYRPLPALGYERAVVRRVQIACENSSGKAVHDGIENRDDRVPNRDGQRASATEIPLHINDQQRITSHGRYSPDPLFLGITII